MIKPLTKKQSGFLSFLKERLQERGYPPTVREIMDGLGLSSTSIVKKYLDVLERKGYIKRQFNSPRAIEIIEASGRSLELRSVPIMGRVRAGTPHPAIEDVEGYLSVDKTICRSNNAFFLRVVGDSMIDCLAAERALGKTRKPKKSRTLAAVGAPINDEATV